MRPAPNTRASTCPPIPSTDTFASLRAGRAASQVRLRSRTWRMPRGCSACAASPGAALERGGRIHPRWLSFLISSTYLEGFEPPPWLAGLRPALVGAFSADNMDYVPRDSYICGVSAGPVDVQRIIHYSFVSERGLTLHAHAAEALYIFLNSRLYLYHQVYFHRTVRRIDLQLREVFRPTLELLLGGNPLERLDRYQALTEWSLLSDVDQWAHGRGDASQR